MNFKYQVIIILLFLLHLYFMIDVIRNNSYKEILKSNFKKGFFYIFSLIGILILLLDIFDIYYRKVEYIYAYICIVYILGLIFLDNLRKVQKEDYFFIVAAGNLWMGRFIQISFLESTISSMFWLLMSVSSLVSWYQIKDNNILGWNKSDNVLFSYRYSYVLGGVSISCLIGLITLFIFQMINVENFNLLSMLFLFIFSFFSSKINKNNIYRKGVVKVLNFFSILSFLSFFVRLFGYFVGL